MLRKVAEMLTVLQFSKPSKRKHAWNLYDPKLNFNSPASTAEVKNARSLLLAS
jgi:hypothetical protein